MEGGAITSSMEKEGSTSYTYWVREVKSEEAAPLPVPRKLTTHDLSSCSSKPSLGSAWNHAGTWEEKNLNKWASDRMKELLVSMDSLEFSGGKADVTDVTKCVGDAFLVTVRNKKRVGYTYELTLKVKGEWHVGEEKKVIKGHLDVPEFSFGELDELQIEVRLSEDKDLVQDDKRRIIQDLKQFLRPLREKLLQFEEELKDR
ncbi:Activator of Hsp90 ATPase, N-terminal [Dillenia turbinata]|uniref:Activator of Hsp90 ATPase, N-terminal n=1 Tax=Dillenia turbinata TaxID=194707 RepID=A0AAN8W4I2_9MAGN